MFDKTGYILYPTCVGDPDTVFEAVFESGANDVISSEDGHEITCYPEELNSVCEALEARLGVPQESGLFWKPQNRVNVNESQAGSLLKLLNTLDDNDDVQNVSSNFDISEDVLAKLA